MVGETPTNATPRDARPPATSGNLATLEDLRYNEVVHHVHLENRLSSVPNYPVFMEQPPSSSRRRRSQRPASIASCSTTGLFLSVGQLPGSEPFEDDQSHVVLNRGDAPGSHPITSSLPLVSPLSAFEASVAQVMTLQRVQTVHGATPRTSRGVSQASWFLETSNLADGWNPPAGGYYSPNLETRPSIRASQTWPTLEQRASLQREDLRNRFSKPRLGARDINTPPVPPPKDPGYVARRPSGVERGHRLRRTNSTPNLVLFPTLHRRTHNRTKSVGFDKIANHGNTNPARIKETKRVPSTRKSSNRPSQILSSCARFITRSVPRINVSC